ncbi:MAG: bifunctional 3,4-dihydroxy-2-butanone-4-phosphate synthase/GTP cyclohydrolase II [Gammaproteobacteria bacterium]|nr:bifunctional 3,4-dihydroxy-2-butanone-4-phosphate synthase/GTP cyclohydrolase II [Gammaproteobacteria bacterium]
MSLNTTKELIDEISDGRMVIIMDDEDRENEGDFVVAAAHCTAEHINFMARHGRGLICMTLTEERCRHLNLPLMVQDTFYTHRTNFTVSIEAAQGVTTGISAGDRARTVQAAVAPDAVVSDLVQPGHIFPLMAQSGGVLTRAGHTEAGCDLARLAGLEPAAVIVEILNDDGTMARRPDLERIAQEFDLKIGTIADLIRFRIENEKTVNRVADSELPTEFGDFHLYAYQDAIRGDLHMAMVKGVIDANKPTLVRVHIYNPFEDLTASVREDAGWPLRDALRRVNDAGEGVIVVLSNQVTNEDLLRQIERFREENAGLADRSRDINPMDWRQFGLGAQILVDLGVRKMRVMSNPRKYHAISGFGLEVVEYVT